MKNEGKAMAEKTEEIKELKDLKKDLEETY